MISGKRRFSVWMWLLLVAATVSFTSASASAQGRRYGTYNSYNSGITVFVNPNFSGQSATFQNDIPDLRAYGLNDKITSIQIPNGESWEVCLDINYGNRCQIVSGNISDLRSMGWNDSISSLRRVTGFQGRRSGGVMSPSLQPELVIFDRPGFRGASRTMTSQTSNVGSIGARGGSVEVRSGTWQLCDRYGSCATVSQNVSDLSQLGLRGQITSARPINNYDGRYDRGNGRDRRYRY